jgi:leader peptidase (prepilin peptidase)/N-methyltransferase
MAAEASSAVALDPRRAPARRPFLPASIAVLLVGASFAELSAGRAVVAAVFAPTLAVLAAIDIEQRIIPNRIVLPATGAVLVAQLALFPGQAGEWIAAPLLLALALVVPQLLGRAWMGMGDVKLALLLGAGLGWGAFSALLIAFVCVLPVALVLLFRHGLRARKAMIPFGPFMSLGALVVLFVPHLVGLPSG